LNEVLSLLSYFWTLTYMQKISINNSSAEEFHFLSGGGEMGALIRSKEWERTPLGNPATWPQSLRTMVSVMLDNPFGMYIAWGRDYIQLYNDGYRPILGTMKHPQALGSSTRQTFAEIWEIIGPMFENVMKGHAVGFPDFMLPLNRNGFVEECYFDFSYSPIRQENGEVGGILVTVVETTNKKKAQDQLRQSELRFQAAVAAVNGIVWTNNAEGRMEGKQNAWAAVTGQTYDEYQGYGWANVVHPDDRQATIDAWQDAVAGKKTFVFNHRVLLVSGQYSYFHVRANPLKNEDGSVREWVGVHTDTTEKRKADIALAQSERNLRLTIMQAPVAIAILRGRHYVVEIANDRALALWGRSNEEVIDRPILIAMPELQTQGIPAIFSDVFVRGKPFSATEKPVQIFRKGKMETAFVNFVYEPLFDTEGNINGIMTVGTEVTEQVMARRTIEDSDKRFRETVNQAPIGIVILRGHQYMVEMANDAYLALVDRTEPEFVGRPLFDSLPEVEASVHGLLDEVMRTGTPYHGSAYPVPVRRYGKEEISYFDFLYHPLTAKGHISGIMVTVIEVTESVKAKHALAESEQHFRNVVTQSPVAMCIFRGEEFVIEMANEEMLTKIWKKQADEVIGKRILDIFPELTKQKYPELLREVLVTGQVHRETEAIAIVDSPQGAQKFYLDFEYAPLHETDGSISGIMVTVYDVSDKVAARQKVEHAEERLRLAAEATELATWDLDLTENEILYSPRLLEIFGRGPTHVLSHQDMRNQIHPDDLLTEVETAFDEALQTGVYKYEARVIRPDKKICWIRTQGKVIFDETKSPVKIIGTLRDITDERQAQKDLESREQKFRLLAESMPQLIWTGDPQGNLTYFNQAVYTYSGLTPEDVHSGGWITIVHPEDQAENLRKWRHSVHSGNDFLCEHRFRRYDGEYRWQLSRAVPQKDTAGNIQMWVGTSTDIQDMKEQEQQKDYFISLASHELKTPITSIKAYTQILQSTYEKSNDRFLIKSLHIIDRQILKLTNLIADLLDLSKIKSGSLTLRKEKFEVNKLIEEVIDEIKHINPGYTFNFSKRTPISLTADRERIGQVIINFLTNAVKYSPQSGLIEVESLVDDNKLIISVEDFGIGINKSDQEKIFERFYRVEGKSEKTFPGFGIGLFIATEIVRRHGGEIGVNSELGKGSVFYFTIPLEGSPSYPRQS